jgi:hypothetical protein
MVVPSHGRPHVRGGVTLSSSETEFVAASQEILYLRALLKGFAYLQHGPTEIWEDNASCILMSENPTNRERSRHVDVRVHFLRDMVRDGSVKLIKCAGTQNVADTLTKSLPRPAFHKHREFLKGTAQSFSDIFASAEPVVPAYVTKRGSLYFSKPPPDCLLRSPSGLYRWIMFISITPGGERSRPLGLLGVSHGLWDRFGSIA